MSNGFILVLAGIGLGLLAFTAFVVSIFLRPKSVEGAQTWANIAANSEKIWRLTNVSIFLAIAGVVVFMIGLIQLTS